MAISNMFPNELLSALQVRRLVIFAGAGVSKGKPANLPDFKDLVTHISQVTGADAYNGESSEPLDNYLGRLQDDGTNVHAIAAEILQRNLCGETPQPTVLHMDLLRLFSQSPPVRLVTTNFDLLFQDAATEVLDSAPHTYHAPALPYGGNFDGIVHIHGELSRPPSMVLTDRDFGRAYVTEGWARRFLLDLFRSFSVLFVGYSHNDTVMHYLSRALPDKQSEPRFALVKDEQDEIDRWRRLGISPLPYPTSPDDRHAALYKLVRDLADPPTRGLLDWQREITRLARNSPPLQGDSINLLDEALSDPKKTRFFIRAANDPNWIDWLDKRGHFQPLFGNGELPQQHLELSRWLSETFSRDHPGELFLLIARHGTRLHPDFWIQLSRVVGSKDDPPLPDKLLSQWVSLLLTTAAVPLHYIDLSRLAARCAQQRLFAHLVEIFDVLTAPRLTLVQESPSPDPHQEDHARPLGIHLTLMASSEHWINHLWQETIASNLDHIALPLLARITARLAARHQAHIAWQLDNSNFDPEDFRRQAIEPHEQDQLLRPVDVLVNAARDCLESVASHRPVSADSWCDDYADAQAPVLRRLCVHTLLVRQDVNPDQKCAWLLNRMDIYDPSAHHEMFRIMYEIYPNLGTDQRQALIQAIRAYRSPTQQDNEVRTARGHYDWLEWLQRAEPGCPLLAQELHSIGANFPEFEPRDHPDFKLWIGRLVRVDDKTPWTVEQLLSASPEDQLNELLSFEPTDPLGPRRSGLLLSLEQAATQRFDWGLDLSIALVADSQWRTDLWTALLRAWSKSELDDGQLHQVLRMLCPTELRDAHIRSIANFLSESAKPSSSPQLDESLQLANELAFDSWDRLRGTEPHGTEFHDWLTRAINHPAGNLAQFWVYSLWYSRNRQQSLRAELTEPYRSALSRILEDQTVLGTLGRCVLCRSFAYLLEADETWTTERLFPLFDFDYGLPDSTAAWCGFLYGNTTVPSIEAMKHKFFAAVTRLQTDFREQGLADRFIEAYTFVLFFHITDPLSEWIPRLLQNTDSDGHRSFAWHVRHYLTNLDDTQLTDCWNRWLTNYWERRLHGVPLPLSPDEIDSMLSWLPHLEPVFSEAVEVAVQMPRVPLREGFILDEIIETNLHETHPESVTILLNYLSHCALSHTVWQQATGVIAQLLQSDVSQPLKTRLHEILAEFGL